MGQIAIPGTTATGYVVETGPLRLTKSAAGGDLFDRVAWRASDGGKWTDLGSYQAVLQVQRPEGSTWPHADRVTGVRVLRQNGQQL